MTAKQTAQHLNVPIEWVKARTRRPRKGGQEPKLSQAEIEYLRWLLEREAA